MGIIPYVEDAIEYIIIYNKWMEIKASKIYIYLLRYLEIFRKS